MFFLTSASYNLSLLSQWLLDHGEVIWYTCPNCDWSFHSHVVSALWPFVNFSINHLLQKTYLVGSESCTNLWVERDKSLKNSLLPCSFSNNRFTPGVYELLNHEFLDRFAVSSVYFLLWNKSLLFCCQPTGCTWILLFQLQTAASQSVPRGLGQGQRELLHPAGNASVSAAKCSF